MPAPNAISVHQLGRLIATPRAPLLLDVRSYMDWAADPRSLPGSIRIDDRALPQVAAQLGGQASIAVCKAGHSRSHGAAAWLRAEGCPSEYLEGGFEAWRAAGLPLIDPGKLPPRDGQGRTVWVTRSRPKIDRIACPWLLRRFVDPRAVILFVAPAEVAGVAERYAAAAFDIEDVFWSHRGDLCTFDVMLAEFGLSLPALDRLASIVRGADTARLDLAPEAAGLLAASLGLSRMYADDLAQLDAGGGRDAEVRPAKSRHTALRRNAPRDRRRSGPSGRSGTGVGAARCSAGSWRSRRPLRDPTTACRRASRPTALPRASGRLRSH